MHFSWFVTLKSPFLDEIIGLDQNVSAFRHNLLIVVLLITFQQLYSSAYFRCQYSYLVIVLEVWAESFIHSHSPFYTLVLIHICQYSPNLLAVCVAFCFPFIHWIRVRFFRTSIHLSRVREVMERAENVMVKEDIFHNETANQIIKKILYLKKFRQNVCKMFYIF